MVITSCINSMCQYQLYVSVKYYGNRPYAFFAKSWLGETLQQRALNLLDQLPVTLELDLGSCLMAY